MKTIDLLDNLRNYPVFTINDIERLTKSKRNYSKLLINRLKKKEYIFKIENGKYTTNNLKNIELISTSLVFPSYISYWYASYYKGYTDQIINKITIATTIKKKQLTFQNYILKFIKTNDFFGSYKENGVFIVDDNKLLIDAFLKPREFGNFDEILKVVNNSKFDKIKIIKYLKKINNVLLIRKIGYVLEKYRQIDIYSDFKVLKYSKNYTFLNPFYKKSTYIDKKWRIKI